MPYGQATLYTLSGQFFRDSKVVYSPATGGATIALPEPGGQRNFAARPAAVYQNIAGQWQRIGPPPAILANYP